MVLLFTAFIFGVILVGCYHQPRQTPAEVTTEKQPPETEGIDPSCAYFYFLWAAHAEQSGQFKESLEAYQKALICDPESAFIQAKIPLLLAKNGERDEAITYLEQHLTRSSTKRIDQKLFLATLYLDKGEEQKALALYEQILETAPERKDVLLKKAALHTVLKDFIKAEKIYKELIAQEREMFPAHLGLARLFFQTNKQELAKPHYLTALQLNWSAHLVHEIAAFYKSTGNFQGLVDLYEEYIQTDAYDEMAQFGLVEGYLQLGQKQKAVARLSEMREVTAPSYTVDLLISKIDLSNNQKASAIARLKKLLDSPAASEAGFLLAVLHAQKDQTKALAYLADIKNDFFDFEKAVQLQANLLMASGQTDTAITTLRKHLSSPADRKPSFYDVLSNIYSSRKAPKQAVEILQEGISQYPEEVSLHFKLAVMLEQDKKREQAMTLMQKVLLLQPDNVGALNYVGYTWADQNIHLDKALDYIEQATKLAPQNGYIRDSLGWVHYRLGNFDKAKQYLEQAAQMDVKDPLVFVHLGDVYMVKAQYLKARKAYKQALKDAEDDEQRTMILKKLDDLPRISK